MAKHILSFLQCVWTLLVLHSLTISGIKLKSSGTHLLISEVDSANARSLNLRQRREIVNPGASDTTTAAAVDVRQFHVNSTLYSRFAKVTMDSEVENRVGEGGREVTFQVQVPEAAFMSSFTMVVGGVKHLAQVLEKEAAEKKYQEAKERNQTAGQVKQVPVKMQRGMELFQITVNLAPHSSATFTLVYNELLERRGGVYKWTLVVQPGTIVSNLSVSASFAERQGFTYFAYTLPGNNDEKLTSSSNDYQTQLRAGVNSRELVFRPTVEMQRQFDNQSGIHGEFTVYYSVSSEPGGGSIIVQNDYFAHFFAPPNLDSLPKNVLFVIDISGSMSGEKIEQARQAMMKILDDLTSRDSDRFNILLFDDEHETWQEEPARTTVAEIERAKGFVVRKMVSRGGTDIHTALTRGLTILLGEQEARSCDIANMIIFLTDGDPTSGITDTDRIIRDVRSKNKDRASIHSLGFGYNLDFSFLTAISTQNQGLGRRIFMGNDAKNQLSNFYEEISKPVLCDVSATYNTDVVTTDLLTVRDFPLHFDGKEIIVAGKTRLSEMSYDPSRWDAKMTGTGPKGKVNFVVPVGKVQVMSESWIEEDLTEKLWAYMKIKSLLKEIDRLDSKDDKSRVHDQALNMSLTYGFVTPLTSFSIIVEDVREKQKLESLGMNSKTSFNYRDVNQHAAGFPTGSACAWRWSWEIVLSSSLLIGLFILQ
ncbi:hypothetical protein ACOMHN_004699 [Nucella lapillus]